ncbi:MAG: TonB-dependent receptor [Acidobacteriota bacterium]|nr:TonB-dependent receptor [Acidobacteriota bacterium]
MPVRYLCLKTLLSVLFPCIVLSAFAADQQGLVRYQGKPVPGVVVIATNGQSTVRAVTDANGLYLLVGVTDAPWHLRVETVGFETAERDLVFSAASGLVTWDLVMLPYASMVSKPGMVRDPNTATAVAALSRQPLNVAPLGAAYDDTNAPLGPTDSLIINGTNNNAATTIFGQSRATGNNRQDIRALYSGNAGVIIGNSAFDARPFSLSGVTSQKPVYSRITAIASLGGPLRIPHLLWQNGPTFALNYQAVRDHVATVQAGIVPTSTERTGDLSGSNEPVASDPSTHVPYPGNTVPVNAQAKALLNLYPLPNVSGASQYNYQQVTTSSINIDSWQSRLTKNLSAKDLLYGVFAGQSTRSTSVNLFGFMDGISSLGLNASVNWQHLYTPRLSMTYGFQYNRLASRVVPYFADKIDVSGAAGIQGNDRDPSDWGPPSLFFSGGTSSLTDGQFSFTRNQTSGISYAALWNHYRHNIRVGADFRRQQFNLLNQQNGRGTFNFTGAATGNDFADFLIGIPDTSTLAYGNADKYLRQNVYDAYLADDFRVAAGLTLNVGVRWDYGSPIDEKKQRLVNLDVSPNFSAASPVLASVQTGGVTGQVYPASLIKPDRSGFEPRIGLAWRPIADSSWLLRAGYGLYYNTSVYLPIASALAQQAPISKSFSVQNSPAIPLTVANGFNPPSTLQFPTYAVDPNLRVGYAQNFNLSVQRDLPWTSTLVLSYLGIRGSHAQQAFLPNTYPSGAADPCPSCPRGFIYLSSGGASSRDAGQVQLRRHLHRGFAASVQYTYAKAIDDAALGGSLGQSAQVIAQDWRNLAAERSLSNFDQRHSLSVSLQYTSGMGKAGITTLQGWGGKLLRDWTIASQITAGTGLPETPIYFATVQGTGVTGTLRPDYSGLSVTDAPPGRFLNPAAFLAPSIGHWGNARRNSITGPSQFGLDSSLGRTFRLVDQKNLELRLDSTNMLNKVNVTSWNSTTTSSQFGLPVAANPMRSMQMTLRLHF